MMKLFKKMFGTAQGRIIKKYSKFVDQINDYELQYQMLSDDELRQKTEQFKARVQKGETLEHLLPEAYAVVKNACRRMLDTKLEVSGFHQEWDMVPYDVQLIGAIAMFYNSIAEMQTGEGKTLTACLPLYLNALSGKSVHLVTVNDYLAKRDCEWVGSIFRWLGLTTGALTNDTPLDERQQIYQRNIVYGTASEFGFDYLRDHSMIQNKEQLVQRGHFFAIIDEVDSILIDEARTPLIISGPVDQSNQMYDDLKKGVGILVKKQIALCNVWATQARKVLLELGLFNEENIGQELSKEQKKIKEEALFDLWKVFK
ncbi:MAG: Protein translocase subunit SecA, partial [Chlamydiae bacterium]|nr:Protein translocase subunit SecA [Chlamydiota bacterium]